VCVCQYETVAYFPVNKRCVVWFHFFFFSVLVAPSIGSSSLCLAQDHYLTNPNLFKHPPLFIGGLKMEGELSLTTMPREMMEEVLSHLSSTRDNSAASSVCKSWKRMVAKLWSLLDATDVQNFEYFATLDLSPSRFKGIKSLKLKNCERYVQWDLSFASLRRKSFFFFQPNPLSMPCSLTTGVLLNLTKKVPNLTHLNLKGCTRLTPYALKTILRTYGTQLTSLKVNHVKDAAKVLSECECGLKLTELSVCVRGDFASNLGPSPDVSLLALV
jgi:hypothetical protein